MKFTDAKKKNTWGGEMNCTFAVSNFCLPSRGGQD